MVQRYVDDSVTFVKVGFHVKVIEGERHVGAYLGCEGEVMAKPLQVYA